MRIAVAIAVSSCLVAPVVSPSAALADPGPGRDVTTMVTDDCARARRAGKTCVLQISAEDVDGALPAGSEIRIGLATFGTAGSLIRIRRDFIPEIVKAAEDL
ncbi:MAG TPA: hypothetical protein VFT22_26015 [Kofleriaceae bacterium]|nr:hypothetical protein [Kofleriaceae bacterium]